MLTHKLITSIKHNNGSYLAEITFECHHGTPAKTYGDPYDCYPEEPPTAEPVEVKIIDVEDGGDEKWIGQYVNWEVDVDDNMLYDVFEKASEEEEGRISEYWDRKYDAMREGDF